MKRVLFAVLLLILFLNFSSAQSAPDSSNASFSQRTILGQCFPEYECGQWSACSDFLQTRVCEDKKCSVRDVREIRFCRLEDAVCEPRVECENWGGCNYAEGISNSLEGEISFGGFRSRVCYDLNNCVPTFIEESICEEGYEFQLTIVKECGEEFLVAKNLITKKQLAKIKLDSLQRNRLDIIALQSEFVYCSSCYNGIIDGNEERADCGGDCKSCGGEVKTPIPLPLVRIFLWSCAVLFFGFFLNETSKYFRKNKNARDKNKIRK